MMTKSYSALSNTRLHSAELMSNILHVQHNTKRRMTAYMSISLMIACCNYEVEMVKVKIGEDEKMNLGSVDHRKTCSERSYDEMVGLETTDDNEQEESENDDGAVVLPSENHSGVA